MQRYDENSQDMQQTGASNRVDQFAGRAQGGHGTIGYTVEPHGAAPRVLCLLCARAWPSQLVASATSIAHCSRRGQLACTCCLTPLADVARVIAEQRGQDPAYYRPGL